MADYKSTKLWGLFEQKANEEKLSHTFIDAVGKVCERGANLSKTVIAFFPTFTLHDETHLRNVSEWMWRLLGGYAEKLTAVDAAYLLMSAWCHDIGMTVSPEEKANLLLGKPKRNWNKYFDAHFNAKQEYETKGSISDETLRDFVRTFHADRAGEKLRAMDWPSELTTEGGIMLEDLIALCQSHGLKIGDIRSGDDAFRRYAALLRMADLLDYDASRAPADLFAHMGLDSPANAEQRISRVEWDKNRSGGFKEIRDGVIRYYVVSSSLQLEKEIGCYLDYTQKELIRCNQFLSVRSSEWDGFTLPNKIDKKIQQNGYKGGEFHITMDQDRVLELLTGRNLYKDAGVFVRELLQNSIDAVLTRRAADSDFTLQPVGSGRERRFVETENAGKIRIDTWNEGGYDWFRIEDDGIGMTEEIITNYFLKVGRSYYASDEFKKELYDRHKNYTPISRFGIGILSCFMAAPENTLLEVSTLRYSHSGNNMPAIRLNVDGLYGYYYLITDETPGCAVKPMTHPKHEDEDDPFRSEPGTTICVRTNLRHLGKYASFREILDEYILCPEVEIEHYAWRQDGTPDKKTYVTQQKLMEMVHAQNPNSVSSRLKKHCYPFPNALFEELKAQLPEFIWKKRPELVFQFYPLDWLDETGNLHGVAIYAHIRLSAHSKPFFFDGKEVRAQLGGRLYLHSWPFLDNKLQTPAIDFQGFFTGKVGRKISKLQDVILGEESAMPLFYEEYPVFKDSPQWNAIMEERYGINRERFHETYLEWKGNRETAFDLQKKYEDILNFYAHLKKGIPFSISDFFWEIVKNNPALRLVMTFQYKNPSFYENLSSCNGITIPSLCMMRTKGKPLHMPQGCAMLYLFNGAYRLELSLARKNVVAISQETFYTLRHLYDTIPDVQLYRKYDVKPELWLTSEQDFRQMLGRHPSWETHLFCSHYLREELDKAGDKVYVFAKYSFVELRKRIQAGNAPIAVDFFRGVDNDFNLLALAVLKDCLEVRREFNPRGFLYVSAEKTGGGTDDFPPEMFFMPNKPCQALGYVTGNNRCHNYYNLEHLFSKWLIENRETMEQERRSGNIFRRLLEEMLTEDSKTGVIKAIASALDELRQLPNNPFHISEALYVSEEAMLAESDFDKEKFNVPYSHVEEDKSPE